MLDGLSTGTVSADVRYVAETEMLHVTIGAHEEDSPGVFHKLTGILSGLGLQIRSAQINTLLDGLVLDRFCVADPDQAGEPPLQRIQQIRDALVQSIDADKQWKPSFRRTWKKGEQQTPANSDAQTRVSIDNSSSRQYTIFDIFTQDRSGLLYAIARMLFQMGMSVRFAKIATYADQVVDVFYVTDRQGKKIDDQRYLEEARGRLLDVVRSANGE